MNAAIENLKSDISDAVGAALDEYIPEACASEASDAADEAVEKAIRAWEKKYVATAQNEEVIDFFLLQQDEAATLKGIARAAGLRRLGDFVTREPGVVELTEDASGPFTKVLGATLTVLRAEPLQDALTGRSVGALIEDELVTKPCSCAECVGLS